MILQTEDELDILVSAAIRRAELLDDAKSPAARDAWREVMTYEERLAAITSPNGVAGGVARAGAVRAALAAGQRVDATRLNIWQRLRSPPKGGMSSTRHSSNSTPMPRKTERSVQLRRVGRTEQHDTDRATPKPTSTQTDPRFWIARHRSALKLQQPLSKHL